MTAEAYAPLQAAAIAFEVGKGLLKNDQKMQKQYVENFVATVIKPLEQNLKFKMGGKKHN